MRHPRAVLAGCGVAFLLLCMFCITGHARTMTVAHVAHPAPPVAAPPPAPVVEPPAPVPALQRAVDAELSQGVIEFDTGRAVLGTGGREVLDRLVTLLQQSPGAGVEIVGHTDDVGTAEANQVLSEARAAAVKAYLVEHGVAAERLTARGEGEENPAGDNATAAGRQLNRRIEFRVR
ncbi:MAG TPA: OmpA family protein [Myxococcaceae bacterium]|nr:OmpA family protein [Myxococcaceae bacterium]